MHQREVNGNRAGRHRRGPRPAQVRTHQGGGQFGRPAGQRQGPRHGASHGGGQGQQGQHGNRQGQPRRKRRR